MEEILFLQAKCTAQLYIYIHAMECGNEWVWQLVGALNVSTTSRRDSACVKIGSRVEASPAQQHLYSSTERDQTMNGRQERQYSVSSGL